MKMLKSAKINFIIGNSSKFEKGEYTAKPWSELITSMW